MAVPTFPPQISGGGPANTKNPQQTATMAGFPQQISGGGAFPGAGPAPANTQYGSTGIMSSASGTIPPQISGGGPPNALSGGLQPYGGTGTAGPKNLHAGSTGTWSSGANPGVTALTPPPAINQQQPDAAWQAGKAQADAQNAANMSPQDRAKAAGDPNWQMYSTTGFGGPQVSGGGPPNTGSGNPATAPRPNPYQPFTATDNLIGSTITTNPSTRTLGAQGATDAAKDAYGGYQFKPFTAQGPVDTSRTTGLLEQGNAQVQGMQAPGYTPVAGTDLAGAQKYLAQAGANVGPSSAASGLMGPGQTGGFGFSGQTGQLRGTTMSELTKTLENTPDRASLAADTYAQMLERAAPQEFAQDRGYAQRTAALGRAGSGMFNSGLADIATARENARSLDRRQLATEAAGLSLSDQMDRLNAARGVTSDFSSADLGAGSLNLGYQNSNNAERAGAFDRARAMGLDTFNQNMSLSDASANLAGIGRNDALTERDALRTAGLDANNVTAAKAASNRTLGSDLYGMDSDAYNRATSERDAGLNYDQNIFNNRQNIFGNMAADEQRLLGNDRYTADEMRGERGYQYGLSRDAVGDQRQQVMDQEALLNGRFTRGTALTNAGYAGDPSGVYGQQAGQLAGQAADSYGSAGDLFGQYAMRGDPRTAPRPNPYAGV